QHRAEQRLAGLDSDGDGKGSAEGQRGSGHERADQRVLGRHEDFRFTGVDHLGDEFTRREIGHRKLLPVQKATSAWSQNFSVSTAKASASYRAYFASRPTGPSLKPSETSHSWP